MSTWWSMQLRLAAVLGRLDAVLLQGKIPAAERRPDGRLRWRRSVILAADAARSKGAA